MQSELTTIAADFESRLRARFIHQALHEELMTDLLAAMAPHAPNVERTKAPSNAGRSGGKREDMGRFGLGIVGDGCKWR